MDDEFVWNDKDYWSVVAELAKRDHWLFVGTHDSAATGLLVLHGGTTAERIIEIHDADVATGNTNVLVWRVQT